MLHIDLVTRNERQIELNILFVNGGALKYGITASALLALRRSLDRELLQRIGDADPEGAMATVISGYPVSEKYIELRQGNRVILQRGKTTWMIVAIEKYELAPLEGGDVDLILTRQQEAIEQRRATLY